MTNSNNISCDDINFNDNDNDTRCIICYDLHTHTTASDGQLTPTLLVQRAVRQGVTVLAITDHDSTLGLAEAQAAITTQALPLQLVAGVEISTCWRQQEIHLVGLQIDTAHQPLHQLLSEQRQLRRRRAQQIAQQLTQAHILDVWPALVAQFSESTALTRQHIARVLVQQRVCVDIKTAFSRYLGSGTVGAVIPPWCRLQHAITLIQTAGGQAVLAHPYHYGLRAERLRQLLVDFRSAGGDAIEVAHCQQSLVKRQQLAHYAQKYQLLASQGSDFHYPGGRYELGRALVLPANCTPVWHCWPGYSILKDDPVSDASPITDRAAG